ncbi:MAG: SRPBCC family protein [Flavobacteriales bacterium]|nr:SRPBCC family protein [Flavobacteriales bacterium]
MTTFSKQIKISAPKQKIWEIISDLGAIQNFHPGVSKSYYTTEKKEGIGAARICELQPSGKIEETVKQWNEGHGFLLQIDSIEKSPPVKDFKGRFELVELNEHDTQASLTVYYRMKLGAIGHLLNKLILQPKMEKNIESLLKGLKVHSEKGFKITDEKTLQQMLHAA